MKDLIPINNDLVKPLLFRPGFLDEKKEQELLQLLYNNKIEEFYDIASKLIHNSYDIMHIYTYLFSKIENKVNQEIIEQVCARLYNSSKNNFLYLPNKDILRFCLKHSKNKVFLNELKALKFPEYYDEYNKIIPIENKIRKEYTDLDGPVKKYIKFLKKYELFTEDIIEMILNATLIYRGGRKIGSLISPETQNLLDNWTFPQIEIQQKKGLH